MSDQLPWKNISTTYQIPGQVAAFRLDCQCGDDSHEVDIWIESNDGDVTLEFSGKLEAWPERKSVDQNWLGRAVGRLVGRLKMPYQIWRHGFIRGDLQVMLGDGGARDLIRALESGLAHATEKKTV